jgi:hypothetical protein
LAFLIGLAWATLLTSPTLHSQSISDIADLFDRDEEDPIPEDDLILLDDVLLNGKGLSQLNLLNLSRASIFSQEDVNLLATYSTFKLPAEILDDKDISPNLSSILQLIHSSGIDFIRSVHLEQMMTFSDDIRYKWKGVMEIADAHVGFLLERDPGERNVMDYASFYIEKHTGSIRWIVGDHQVLAGYGLSSWRNSPTRRGFDVLSSLQRSGSGLKPYRSSHEFWKTRGTGISIDSPLGNWTVSLGHNSWDGTIDSTGMIKVNETGTHPLTKISSSKLNESSFTAVWEAKSEGFSSGAVFSRASWVGKDASLHRQSSSLYFSKFFHLSHFFAEAAIGFQNSYGAIAGYGISFKRFRYLIHGRYYSSGFEAFRANPVSEWSSREKGERGVFQSIKFGWPQNTIVLYGDLYGRIKSDNIFVSPVNGFESGIRWILKRKHMKTRIQWSSERKTVEDDPGFHPSSESDYNSRQTMKGVYDYTVNSFVKLRLQIQETKAGNDQKIVTGKGAASRIWVTLRPWGIELDWVSAKVEDYDSRIYFWDVNLPGEMRSTMYSKDASSVGVKVVYNTKRGWYSGIRYRIKWEENSSTGRSSAGVFIRASV